ncbi:WG repeat-containing protein [Chitinophaga niabensis]|uniref:WG containing repeat-containing protein n=1 Tax=Chitinophaga niabensis TaxID=536979 RepID=A0A1N6K0D1_9BACT|nr:WG repeat-containing protein [Chitinophaga niabensis]SIO50052.1 WG containing repeat-containing protein [Chitinophaga niabensis]
MKKHYLFLCLLFLTSGAYSQLIPYRVHTKWGFADMTGKLVIPARYDNVWRFRGKSAVVKLNKKYGLIDSTGKLLLPVIYDDIDPRELKKKTWYILKTSSKYGLANTAGKLVLPVKYDELSFEMQNSYAMAVARTVFVKVTPDDVVQEGTKSDWQAFEKMGISMIGREPEKDFMMPYTLNNKKGYLVRGRGAKPDSIPAIYDEIDEINIYDNILRVKKDGLWGVIGPRNNIVFPFLYEEMGSASPGMNLYSGKKGGKSGILKPNGEVLVPFEYDRFYFSNDEFWCISYQNGRKGIIILDGNTPVFIPARYKNVSGNPVEIYEYQGRKVRFFEVETEQGYGYVREDGVDYFKDGK